MRNESLVIMAGGASSRMKKSLEGSLLSDPIREAAKSLHKSLIPLDGKSRPLLYFLFENALKAGVTTFYIITSTENEAFQHFIQRLKDEKRFKHVDIKFAIQKIPNERKKPLGTADALQQCLEQHPELLEQRFSVCNGDNLYSTASIKILRQPRNEPHALMAYDGIALGHSKQKIKKFALLDFNKNGLLTQILEKPTRSQLDNYTQRHQKLWVSMNLFNFHGAAIFTFLKNCPINPVRKEKELPQAVQNYVHNFPGSLRCFQRFEKIPDLTRTEDIATFFKK